MTKTPDLYRQVTQTLLANEAPGVYGNCLQAAVASVSKLPLDAVPHFSAFVWWEPALELWLRGRGLTMKRSYGSSVPWELSIVGGRSPRGFDHVVIGLEGQIVWDPHPSRDGLETITDAIVFEDWPTTDRTCWMCKAAMSDA